VKEQTLELCLAAVQQSNGEALEFVTPKYQNREVFLAAVKQHGSALKFVPPQYRAAEICLAAIKQNEMALCYVEDVDVLRQLSELV